MIKSVFYWLLGCPSVVRMDRGTENVCVAAAQFAFRAKLSGEELAEKSFMYGRSPANVVCKCL